MRLINGYAIACLGHRPCRLHRCPAARSPVKRLIILLCLLGPAIGQSANIAASGVSFLVHTDHYRVQALADSIQIYWPDQILHIQPLAGHRTSPMTRTRDLPHPEKIIYPHIYPGIDWILYRHEGQLEYDFVVAPAADPQAIRLAFTGGDLPELNNQGELLIRIGQHTLRQPAPNIYQWQGNQRVPVEGGYQIDPQGAVGFHLGSYDHDRTLIIDPILVEGSYLGGTGSDQIHAITTDAQGNTYVTGMTSKGGFPSSTSHHCTASGCSTSGTVDQDVFISQFSADGQLQFTTYLEGSGQESGQAIAVDATGIYISGWTTSTDFPLTTGSYAQKLNCPPASATPVTANQKACDGSDTGFKDAFVAKISSTGNTIIYATYLGGRADDAVLAMDLNSSGQVYVTGFTRSADFPTTTNAYSNLIAGRKDVFLARLNASGIPDYSSYLGGQGDDEARAIAVNGTGIITLAGYTGSGDFDNSGRPTKPFPTTSNAFDRLCGISETLMIGGISTPAGRCNGKGVQGQHSTAYDAFVTQIDPTQASASAQLKYSSFLGGGRYDTANAVALAANGDIVVGGETESADFPVTTGAFNAQCRDDDDDGRCDARSADGFVARIQPGSHSLVYASYLGGDAEDRIDAIAIDPADRVYVTGTTQSRDYPSIKAIQAPLPQRQDDAILVRTSDAFVSRLSADGSQLDYSSHLGGRGDERGTALTLDNQGVLQLAGYTLSANFPVSDNAAQARHGDLQGSLAVNTDDGFLVRIVNQDGDLAITLQHDAPNPLPLGQNASFTATIRNLGTERANGVELTDVLPPQAVKYLPTLSDPACQADRGTVHCALNTIETGQDRTLKIVVRPKNQGDYPYTIRVSARQSESDSSNDSATAVLHVAYQPAREGGTAVLSPGALMLILYLGWMNRSQRRKHSEAS